MKNWANIDLLLTLVRAEDALRAKEAKYRKESASLLKLEREAERLLRNEEDARSAYARRIQSKAEAEDRLARMGKYNPGVQFLGYKSPARRRLSEMKQAALEQASSASVAEERRDLAVHMASRIRRELMVAQTHLNRWIEAAPSERNPKELEHRRNEVGARLCKLAQETREADIDDAVMNNRISKMDAALIREHVRRQARDDLER